MARARAEYEYTARDKTAEALRSVKSNVLGVDKAMSSVRKMIGLLAGGAGIGLIIKNTLEAEKVLAQLDARLKSTGGAAGLSKQELIGMAQGMQEVTTFGDEAIIGAENLLLTFTKIGRDVFPEALEAVLNVSTALNQDLQTSAIAVGKALNDPIKGVTALGRSGIQFTEQQKDVIKALVETGRTADAQKLILAELETQMGGSARAARDTFGGAITSLGNAFGDLLEGDVEGGGIRGAVTSINDLTDMLQSAETKAAFATTTSAVFELLNVVTKTAVGFVDLGRSIGEAIGRAVAGPGGDLFDLDAEGLIKRGREIEERMADIQLNPWKAQFGEKDKLREDLKAVDDLYALTVSSIGAKTKAVAKETAAAVVDTSGLMTEEMKKAATEHAKQQADILKMLRSNWEAAEEEQRKHQESIDDYVTSLQRQIETMHMSSVELVEYELGMLGASEATIEHAKALETQRMTMEQNLDLQRMLSEDALALQRDLEKETKKTDDIARELGLTFSSAFEDMMIAGKGFREVLGGIFDDLQRLILRKTITEPLFEILGGILDSFDFGLLFGGGKAFGGPVMAGVPYLVGEQGPELFMPRSSGSIVPNDKLAGGGITINTNIDARGSTMSETRMKQILDQRDRGILREIEDRQQRNRRFA